MHLPNLGDKVAYIRQTVDETKELKFEEGEGTVLGIGLSPDGIPIALIRDAVEPEKKFNTQLGALNASDEFICAYKMSMTEIHETAQSFNKQALDAHQQLIDKGNARVKEINESLFGPCVNL